MKFREINCYSAISYLLFTISNSSVYGETMGPQSIDPMHKLYIGVFGGGGEINKVNISQKGTAFYGANKGGPLAVNAIGESSSQSAWIVGGNIGYQWSTLLFNNINQNWNFSPAVELEGYYLGSVNLHGDDINNETVRLAEHDFYVTYPINTGVFLINAKLNANHANFNKIHPYIGFGIGAAVISITGANSTQKTPAEPGINHYNSGTSDTSQAFAAQPKIGVEFNLSQNTNMFVEYRFLYLAASNFTFGSTVYPTHVATSNWDVNIGSQYYNMGTIGIKYDL